MILPFPKISFSIIKCPMTWVLVTLNIIIFLFFYDSNSTNKLSLESSMDDEYFYQTQARIYKSYVDENSLLYSETQKKIINHDIHNKYKARVIASFALSDVNFVRDTLDQEFSGDQVAIANWRSKFKEILNLQKETPNYQFGLLVSSGLSNLLTYQFMHASFGHLLSNMIFLFLFGALLESLFGGFLLLVTYCASGVVAALVFLYFSTYVNSPLVGASGSISGIIAAYCLSNLKNNIRFFYFLYIPKPEYMGFVYFRPWILLLYWLVTDITGYLSQVTEFSGVAYTAHMGGHFAGIVISLILLLLWKAPKRDNLQSSTQAGELIPLTVFVRSKASTHSVFSNTPRFHKLP